MTYQVKKVFLLTEERQREVRSAVHGILYQAAEKGSEQIGSTGLSFILISLSVWAADLADLDKQATIEYFRAVADVVESWDDEGKMKVAEERRLCAFDKLARSLDLMMAEVGGRA